jgi:hypothetical protein
MRRLLALLVLVVPGLSAAQFQGLEKKKKPPEPGVVVPASPDYAEGESVIALPPRNAAGKLDADSYRILYAALKERFGKRLVDDYATLKALDTVDITKLTNADVQKGLAAQLKGEAFVIFSEGGRSVSVTLIMKAGELSAADAVVDLSGGKLTQALARKLVADLLKRGSMVLSPSEIDVSPPEVAAPPPEPEQYEDVAAAVANKKAAAAETPLNPIGAGIFVGAGAAFRALIAGSAVPVVPHAPAAMAAMGFQVTVFPLRFLPQLSTSKLAELGLEGYYRYDIVRGDSQYNGVETTCSALDDEMRGQLFYRYPLGGRLPKIGLGVGIASERTRFASACTAPALNTQYGSTEIQLKVQQPILGEMLFVDVSGGPRILFSTRASGYGQRAWSLEGWFTARPMRFFAVRLGARFTQTMETTWPEGVSIIDNRTFVGVEVGATL